MGRVPKKSVDRPPISPTPETADYSDEVSKKDIAALKQAVKDDIEADEWELVDGPGW